MMTKHVQQHVLQAESVGMLKLRLVSLEEILTKLKFKKMAYQVYIINNSRKENFRIQVV